MNDNGSAFKLAFPVWVLEKDEYLVSMNAAKYGRCLLVFTSEVMALAASSAMNLTGTVAQSLDVPEFRAALQTVLTGGDTHVGFDVSVPHAKGVFESIRTILAGLP